MMVVRRANLVRKIVSILFGVSYVQSLQFLDLGLTTTVLLSTAGLSLSSYKKF